MVALFRIGRFLFLLAAFNSYAGDTRLIYNLPHKIRIEFEWDYKIEKQLSSVSQNLFSDIFRNGYGLKYPIKVVNDTSYFSDRNNEIEKLLEGFHDNYKIDKIVPSETLLAYLETQNIKKVVFVSANGMTKRYNKDLVTLLMDAITGGPFFMIKKKPSLQVEVLVLNRTTKKFTYFESAGDYGEPLNMKFAKKIVQLSIDDFF
jgi:hypothetical protein